MHSLISLAIIWYCNIPSHTTKYSHSGNIADGQNIHHNTPNRVTSQHARVLGDPELRYRSGHRLSDSFSEFSSYPHTGVGGGTSNSATISSFCISNSVLTNHPATRSCRPTQHELLTASLIKPRINTRIKKSWPAISQRLLDVRKTGKEKITNLFAAIMSGEVRSENYEIKITIISFSCYTTSSFVAKHLQFTKWQTDKEKDFWGTFAKLRKVIIRFVKSVCLSVSVCPHETTRLPLDGFSLNFTFECFCTTCPENPGCIKILQQ